MSGIDDQQGILIYNPVAGRVRRGGDRMIERAVALLASGGWRVSAQATSGPGAAGEAARQAIAAGASRVYVLGGDGTINEAAGGMIGSRATLGILPGGTANVLANELGLGNDIERAAQRLAHCVPRRIPVGRIRPNGAPARHFLLMAGAGLDARIVHGMGSGFKKRWGKAAYWIGGFRQIVSRLEEFEAVVDGVPHPCTFALITKVRNYGGDLEIARRVRILDDSFEILLFTGQPGPYLKYLLGIAINRLYGMRGVTVLRAQSIFCRSLSGVPVPFQIDGEASGSLPGEVEMIPDALTLLMPPDYA